MKRVMVRYKVKPSAAGENAALVRAVFDELARTGPAGLRYATLLLPDGVSFVHIASIETADGSNPLGSTPAFKAFQAQIKDRCDDPPVATDVQLVGSYRLFSD